MAQVMEEELKALKELIEETAKKYDIYINMFSFYGKDSNLTYQTKGEENNYKYA